MKIPPVKGTRDFFPSEMAIRNFIVDGWKQASVRNGFEEYDGPIFEYLKMYQIKSGDEIAEQLFNLTDRGGRDLAIRPEITPTLARMVNQQINSLARPIKWFSVPRLCRAERPQKGRLREFFQWNIDIIGVEDVTADAEVIFTTVDYLRQVGLTSDDIKVKISSRKLLAAFLKSLGIPEKNLDTIYTLLDKKAKLPPETFEKLLVEQIADSDKVSKILDFMSVSNISELPKDNEEIEGSVDELAILFNTLRQMGIDSYCKFDPGIVRGLAYYTGVVFEVHEAGGELRAIAGGGRYDNLLKQFGGPQVTGTGMGMGDCVLEILLEEKKLLNFKTRKLDYYIASIVEALSDDRSIEITAKLRTLGFLAERNYKTVNLKKQLKSASDLNAKYCVILGDELQDNLLLIKDMGTGQQQQVDIDTFFDQLETESK
ncbi:histidine--tRNA ligase [Planctomycetota bacterium]